MLERYLEQGQLTLFDFDGYDHRKLGMSFKDVIHCSTRICGHAFVDLRTLIEVIKDAYQARLRKAYQHKDVHPSEHLVRVQTRQL